MIFAKIFAPAAQKNTIFGLFRPPKKSRAFGARQTFHFLLLKSQNYICIFQVWRSPSQNCGNQGGYSEGGLFWRIPLMPYPGRGFMLIFARGNEYLHTKEPPLPRAGWCTRKERSHVQDSLPRTWLHAYFCAREWIFTSQGTTVTTRRVVHTKRKKPRPGSVEFVRIKPPYSKNCGIEGGVLFWTYISRYLGPKYRRF